MKKSNILLSILAVSLSVNAFLLLTGFEPQTQCPEIPSYGQSVTVNMSDAERSIDNYKANVPENAVTGGVISGASLKQALCASGSNGISYYLAQDPERNIANGDVFIVFTGVDVATDANGDITSIRKTGNKLFRAGNWCPTNCVILNAE